MPDFQLQIEYSKACPKLNIADISDYPDVSETHLRSDFNQFAKMYITYPNGEQKVFSSFDGKNFLQVPLDSIEHPFDTCLTGLFTAKFIALPSPRESMSEDCTWGIGDCFYFNGKIYLVEMYFSLPDLYQTNEEIIALMLSNRSLIEITESEIPSEYISEIKLQHWCTLFSCYKKKLEKINCLIVKEPLRDDLCKVNCGLLDEVLQLHYIQYDISLIGDNQEQSYLSEVNVQELIKKYSNYVNEICCCKKCCDDC